MSDRVFVVFKVWYPREGGADEALLGVRHTYEAAFALAQANLRAGEVLYKRADCVDDANGLRDVMWLSRRGDLAIRVREATIDTPQVARAAPQIGCP